MPALGVALARSRLRRQLKRDYRKPLVLMTPKSLLRHKLAVSRLDEMTGDSSFQFVIPETDAIAEPEKVKRVVLCSGKVYYQDSLIRTGVPNRAVRWT